MAHGLVLRAFIPGVPKPKGSMRLLNRRSGKMVEAVAGSSEWKALMASALRQEWTPSVAREAEIVKAPERGPIFVNLEFVMPTRSVIKRGAGSADLDKLVRNVMDALQDAGVYGDDVQVTQINAWKRMANGAVADAAGVDVSVYAI